MEPQIGLRFDRLETLRFYKGKKGETFVECRCDCGQLHSAAWYDVKVGKVKSCGCLKSEVTRRRNTRHGGKPRKGGQHYRLYGIWQDMRRRCEDSTRKQFPDYGGRGITVCPEWQDFGVFREWALTHGYLDTLTIDRIDVNRNYTPENCQFITLILQMRNRRTSHHLTAFGETKTIRDWVDDPRCSVTYGTLSQRIVKLHWDAERAITTP